VLVERISLFQPAAISRRDVFNAAFVRHGSDSVTAHHQAFRALDGIINAQAALKSYADIFRYVGIIFLMTLPLLLFLDKGKNKAAAAEVH
jgi:DHA2 family multidrug resistance protein